MNVPSKSDKVNEIKVNNKCDKSNKVSQIKENSKYDDRGEDEESAVADFLSILEEHRKNCEQQGKYVEAEIAKSRLEELRSHEGNRMREAMRNRQITERLGVEEAHMLEFRQFNSSWDKKMCEYESHAESLVTDMKKRHTTTLKLFQEELLAKQKRPKFSTKLLNFRKIQEHLAKAKDYSEAQKVKSKADKLEERELENWRRRQQHEVFQQETKFKNTKQQELVALLKRIQTGREEHNKQRQLELGRLQQRYQNVKNELEASQNLEKRESEKIMQTVGSLALIPVTRKGKAVNGVGRRKSSMVSRSF